jgi:hypothetical protein
LNNLAAAVRHRGISRITHFTNSRNLPRILAAGAILSTAELAARQLDYAVTDPERFDGHRGHICCNIEYPNMYYFHQASARPTHVNFSDWTVLLLAPEVATTDGVLFSPGNAARGSGRFLASGPEALAAQYAANVNSYPRGSRHFPASPTDVQAEVLIPGPIPLSELRGIVVSDSETLRRELVRLEQLSFDPSIFDWYVAPTMFTKGHIVGAVQRSVPIAMRGPFKSGDEVAP